MSAKDKYHDTVVRALQKDGWKILKEQYRFVLDNRRLWIDIRAAKDESSRVIFVEVKSFVNMPSEVAYLQLVLGQYLLYRAIIEDIERGEAIYLAVPEHAYNGIFDEYIGQLAIHHFDLKLIIFDIKREAIIKWIP